MDAPQVESGQPVVVAIAAVGEGRSGDEMAGLERRRNVYLATVAHEMRNALAPLSCAIEVLARAPIGAPANDMVPVARRQLAQLAGLTEDLLDLGRTVNDEFHMEFRTESLQALVGGVMSSWSVLAQAKRQAITLAMPTAALLVRADRLRFSQALQNIVGNAVKFTPEGGRIAVSVLAAPGVAIIRVSDTGIGIPPDDLGNVFQLFFRVRREGPACGGFGIGLALTQQVIGRHGGTISAASDGPARGSTFTVTLPLLGPAGVA